MTDRKKKRRRASFLPFFIIQVQFRCSDQFRQVQHHRPYVPTVLTYVYNTNKYSTSTLTTDTPHTTHTTHTTHFLACPRVHIVSTYTHHCVRVCVCIYPPGVVYVLTSSSLLCHDRDRPSVRPRMCVCVALSMTHMCAPRTNEAMDVHPPVSGVCVTVCLSLVPSRVSFDIVVLPCRRWCVSARTCWES